MKQSLQGLSTLLAFSLQNDDVKDFDVKWDHALLSVSKVPWDLILEGLYKSKLENSVQLQIVMALCMIKKRCSKSKEPSLIVINWKLLWKLHIDQLNENSKLQVREWCCGKRIGYQESKKETEPTLRGQWESVYLWKAHGQCSQGDSWTNKDDRDKHPQRDQAVNRKALWTRVKFHAGSNSVEIRHVNSGILPCVWIASLKNDVYMATNVISDMLRHKESPEVQKDQLPYWRSLHNRVVYLKILIRKFYSTWIWKIGNETHRQILHRTPGTKLKFGKERVHREELSKSVRLMSVVLARQNFEERSYGETLTHERCARKTAWDLSKQYINKLKNSDKATVYIPGEVKGMPAPTTSKRPEEWEVVVDSGASMHMMSKKELSSEEMGAIKRSITPTVVFSANGEPAVQSQGKLCEDHGHSFEWVSGQMPRLTPNGKSIICKTDNFVPLVVPGWSANSGRSSFSKSQSQDSFFEFVFRFSIGAKWRTSHQETGAGNPENPKPK